MTTTPTLWRAKQQADRADLSGPGPITQGGQQIVGLPDGMFVVLWGSGTDVGAGAAPGADIIGRLCDANGNQLSDEFTANTSYTDFGQYKFSAAALPSGDFLIVFEDQNTSGTSIRFEVKSPAGAPQSSGTILADLNSDFRGGPSVAVAANGGFLVGYQNRDASGSDTEAVGVDSAGTVSGPVFLYDNGTRSGLFHTDAATLANGDFVVASSGHFEDDVISFRLIGSVSGPGFTDTLDSTVFDGDSEIAPAVAALAGGGFVIAWQNTDAQDTDLEFQIFNAAGRAVTGPVVAADGSSTDDNTAPDVIGLPDGGFVLVWADGEADTIALQRFGAGGVEVGTEVVVTTGTQIVTADTVREPSVTLSDDGRLLVGWTRLVRRNPWVDSDVEFAIFDPRDSVINGDNTGTAITSRLDGATVNGLGGNDTLLGQNANDTLNGGSGVDLIGGRGGNDWLAGGRSVDVLRGGLDNDIYTVNADGEAVELLNQGVDTVRSTVSYGLGSNLEQLVLIGAGNVAGSGNTLDNKLTGNSGVNNLNGLQGDDVLTGGAGVDRFRFTTALDPLTNVDTIADCQVGIDEIQLDDAIFAGLPLGPLAAAAFTNSPANPSDRIIYNAVTGALFFDPDGTPLPGGPGGGATPIRFATLDPGLALTAGDFSVI